MEFEREFEEVENDIVVTGDEQDAQELRDALEAEADALFDDEAGAGGDVETAAGESFSPVEESTVRPDVAADVAGAAVDSATSEQQLDAVDISEDPASQGPSVNIATVSEPVIVPPGSESGPIEVESSSPGEMSSDVPTSGAASAHTPNSDLSPHAQQMLRPTSDGGPPLARPIIIVRLADDQMEQLINETLRRSARRSEQTSKEVAQFIVDQEFWRRDCQERAILGH
jgi:hypothetical protein